MGASGGDVAYIYKNGRRWRAQIDRLGVRLSETFDTKREAELWAAEQETDIVNGRRGNIPDKPFADALIRYRDQVSPHKKGASWEVKRLNAVLADPIALVPLRAFASNHAAEWRDRRLQTVTGSTVNREWNLLSHVCTIAVKEWRWLRENPFSNVRRPANGKPRQRIASDEEIERLKIAAGYPCDSIASRVMAAFLFAVETGMRAGEICSLTEIQGSVAHLTETKNGTSRRVPLSPVALEIWAAHPGGFGLTPTQIDANFRRLKKLAGVEGLTFHDSRATAATRLSKRLDALELARVLGHKNLNELLTYYRKSAEDIAATLAKTHAEDIAGKL